MSFGTAPRGAAPAGRIARWSRRAAVVAIAATVLGTGPAATAAAVAQQPAPKQTQPGAAARVTLGSLACVSSEDFWGDELYIRVNGHKVWAAADSVSDGESIAVNRRVNVGDTVALYDDDSPDGDDFLGSDIVRDGSGTLTFGNDDALYYLDYS